MDTKRESRLSDSNGKVLYQQGDFIWLSRPHCVFVAENIDRLTVIESHGNYKTFNGASFQPLRDYYIDLETLEIRSFIDENTLIDISRAAYERQVE